MRISHANGAMIVATTGRLSVSGRAIELLADLIGRDARLVGTKEAIDYSLIPRIPDAEVDAFCEVLRQWLEAMSPAELSEPEIREIGSLLEVLALSISTAPGPPPA